MPMHVKNQIEIIKAHALDLSMRTRTIFNMYDR